MQVRTSSPVYGSEEEKKFYTYVGNGGYNRFSGNPSYASLRGSCTSLPNCTSYCYGRMMEAWYGTYHPISINGDAAAWFNNAPANMRSSTPIQGAVASFRGGTGGHGHVVFIEKVYNGGAAYDFTDSWYYPGSGGPVIWRYVSGRRAGNFGSGLYLNGYIVPPGDASFPSGGLTESSESRYQLTANHDPTSIIVRKWEE